MAAKQDVLKVQNLEQLEHESKTDGKIAKMAYDYYASGADSESALADNRTAFARFRLIPRMLVDVSNPDCSTKLFGTHLSFPVLVAPMAMQQMSHPDGELAVARACRAAGTAMVVSTMANYSLKNVAEAAGPEHLWFQLYVFVDRDMVRLLVQDAEAAGYKALVVTVDAPFLGNREADVRNRFRLPDGLTLANAESIAQRLIKTPGAVASTGSGIADVFASQIDASLTWSLIDFLKSISSLPVIVKGILHPADAELAVRHGADGLVVSNHGGRQLDYAAAPIDVVGSISAAVRGRIPILLDGGIRRGTDVLKALAMGANAVLIGRPMLYALARGGQKGVEQALEILKREFKLSMALAGCRNLRVIGSGLVVHQSQLPMRSAL